VGWRTGFGWFVNWWLHYGRVFGGLRRRVRAIRTCKNIEEGREVEKKEEEDLG